MKTIHRQLTLFPMPEAPTPAGRATLRKLRRTKLAFLRLVRLIEENPDLPIPDWLLYVVRRTDIVLGDFRNEMDPRVQYRVRERMERKKANPKPKRKSSPKSTNRIPNGIRKSIREWLVENADGDARCAYCDKQLKEITLDHLKPAAKGGTHQAPNLCLACPQCNSVKGNRTPEQWAGDVLSARQKTAAIRKPTEVPAKG